MLGILKDLGALTIIMLFVSIHLIVVGVRGIQRYVMIKKYHYDYYDNLPLNFVSRLRHNLSRTIFKSTTFYISASITIMAFLVFLLFNY